MLNYYRETVTTTLGSVDLITLKSNDMEVKLTSFGAAIFYIKVLGNIVTVQPKKLEDFLKSPFFYGKTIGRTSGRLVLPSYQINDITYPISSFGGKHVKLHGGKNGFAFKPFTLKDYFIDENKVSVTFSYVSIDMEEEYPGKVILDVVYTLDSHLGLLIEYHALSDQDTLCNITNHTYFNLTVKKQTILDHQLLIHADHYLEINDEMIVKSKEKVKGLPYDFNVKSHLGDKIKLMLNTPFKGFDHTWLFNTKKDQIEVDEPSSQVKMIIDTSYPSVVIYTHNFPVKDELEEIKGNGVHSSFTLETQYEPGGIHHDYLNSAILYKDQAYQHHILFRFIKK
jgi:aldose 1-epimerase